MHVEYTNIMLIYFFKDWKQKPKVKYGLRYVPEKGFDQLSASRSTLT